MAQMLTLQVTLFAMMALGFAVKKIGIVSKTGQANLTDLVIDVILPCNIITSFQGSFGDNALGNVLAIFLISVAEQAFAVIYGRLYFPREQGKRKINLRYGMICSNAGFLGNPIAEGVFGAEGLMLASVFLIPMRVMMWSEGIALYSGSHNRRATLKKVITHPCVLACLAGIVLLVFQITLPDILLAPLQTVGRCNTALSMMVIGMILAEIDLKTIFDRTILAYSLHRLVIMPLLLFAVLRMLSSLSVPVSALVTGVSVLLTAMPAGATTSMLAAKYDCDPGFAVRMVVTSTLLSIPAILIWSLVLG